MPSHPGEAETGPMRVWHTAKGGQGHAHRTSCTLAPPRVHGLSTRWILRKFCSQSALDFGAAVPGDLEIAQYHPQGTESRNQHAHSGCHLRSQEKQAAASSGDLQPPGHCWPGQRQRSDQDQSPLTMPHGQSPRCSEGIPPPTLGVRPAHHQAL